MGENPTQGGVIPRLDSLPSFVVGGVRVGGSGDGVCGALFCEVNSLASLCEVPQSIFRRCLKCFSWSCVVVLRVHLQRRS